MPTQFIAEYLANHFTPKLDGIIYSSCQRGGKGRNIVILNHAAVVEDGSSEKSPYDPYSRVEVKHFDESIRVIDKSFMKKSATEKSIISRSLTLEDVTNKDDKVKLENTLRLVPSSMVLARVDSISYESSEYDIVYTQMKGNTNSQR